MYRVDKGLEAGRVLAGQMGSERFKPYGMFVVSHGPGGRQLTIVATDGNVEGELGDWEHVSVSTRRFTPNWREMCWVKSMFWEPEDCVVQYHAPESRWVNNHPNCLHLWRWKRGEFPAPPMLAVGIQELGDLITPSGVKHP